MLRKFLLWCSTNPWMSERFPRYAFVRRAVARFMPGEGVVAALAEAERLNAIGISAVLTLLGENVTSEEEAAQVASHYQSVLGQVKDRDLAAEVSIKLTQLGLDLGPGVARHNLSSIVARAEALGNFVWIDMEASGYVDATLELYETLRRRHANVGVCLQAYLYRTADDLRRLLPLAPAIRLVKGAYAEPAEIAFPKKKDVDANYMKLALQLLDENSSGGGRRIGFATHDYQLIARIQRAAEERGVQRKAYEFQMLYGIARERQEQLAREGYGMRVLISYGSAWFPWYMRRLAERPANLWFVVRSMFG